MGKVFSLISSQEHVISTVTDSRKCVGPGPQAPHTVFCIFNVCYFSMEHVYLRVVRSFLWWKGVMPLWISIHFPVYLVLFLSNVPGSDLSKVNSTSFCFFLLLKFVTLGWMCVRKLLAFLVQLTSRYSCPGFLKLFMCKQPKLSLIHNRLHGLNNPT